MFPFRTPGRRALLWLLPVATLPLLAFGGVSQEAPPDSPTPSPNVASLGRVRVLAGGELARADSQEDQPPVWVKLEGLNSTATVTIGNATTGVLDFTDTVQLDLAPGVRATNVAVSVGTTVRDSDRIRWGGFNLRSGQTAAAFVTLAAITDAAPAGNNLSAIQGLTVDAKDQQTGARVLERSRAIGPALTALEPATLSQQQGSPAPPAGASAPQQQASGGNRLLIVLALSLLALALIGLIAGYWLLRRLGHRLLTIEEAVAERISGSGRGDRGRRRVGQPAAVARPGSLESGQRPADGWVAELERRNRQSSLLQEFGDRLRACLTPAEVYAAIAVLGPRLVPEFAGAMLLLTLSRRLIEVVVTWGDAPPGPAEFASEDCWGLRRGRTHIVERGSVEPVCKHVSLPLPYSYICIPLTAHGETLGILHLRGGEPAASAPYGSWMELSESLQWLAQSMAEQIALTLANLRLQELLSSQAIRDPLTGLFNRRYMEESFERELRRSARVGTPFGVAMLDLDHFKEFNEDFGHDVGDNLLVALGAYLQQSLRAEDIACRYGGEEFVLILPGASLEYAASAAERVRLGVKKLNVSFRGELPGPVTVSIGVASYPACGSSAATLLREADACLLHAKTAGRDRVVVAEPREAQNAG